MIKAYSYIRFSSAEQILGDSMRRQSEQSINYAKQNGLTLDNTYTDQGISAFRGLNAQIGSLKQFLDDIDVGIIEQGSYLLVESLDRISRDEITSALNIFLQIIQSGVTIVTLFDQRKYNLEIVNANPTQLLISLLFMMRAREESTTKSKRIKAAWHNRILNIGAKVLSTRSKIWLRYNKLSGKFEVIPEKAKIIRRIFNMALKGNSSHDISRALNQKKVPTLGIAKFWTGQHIYILLHEPAVTGTITLMENTRINGKLKKSPLMKIENYYPKVISKDVFNRVNEIRPRSKYTGPKKNIRNIFGFLAKCPLCNSSMSKVNSYPYDVLVCSKAINWSDCKIKFIRCEYLENAFLHNIDQISSNTDCDITLKTKINRIKQIVSIEPLDRAKINHLLRQLFTRVIIDYTTGNIVFEWMHGEKTIIKYVN